MTFVPSFSVSLIAFGVLALLAVANWYVSGFFLESGPAHRPGENRKDFGQRHADQADELKKVA